MLVLLLVVAMLYAALKPQVRFKKWTLQRVKTNNMNTYYIYVLVILWIILQAAHESQFVSSSGNKTQPMTMWMSKY